MVLDRISSFFCNFSKIFRPFTLSKNFYPYLDFVCIQSQTKQEKFKVLGKGHQIILEKNMKAARENHIFLTRVKLLDYIIEGITITASKSQLDANLKLQPSSNRRKLEKFWNVKFFHAIMLINCN